jgi:Uma2 family endonuclease
MTLSEFLDWDDGTDRRYELLDGVPVMMAPSLEAHGELAAKLTIEIGTRLQPPCRVISEAGMVVPDRADTYYVADLAVTCAPREPGRRMVVEPVLVVEVLSPSTGQIDRWRKVADYRTLPSVQEILVVFSDERRVEVQRRAPDGWRGRGSDRQSRNRSRLLQRPDPARWDLSGPCASVWREAGSQRTLPGPDQGRSSRARSLHGASTRPASAAGRSTESAAGS